MTSTDEQSLDTKNGWRRVAFKHVAGIGVGAAIGVLAGLSAGALTRRGGAAIGGLVGVLASLGFGDTIYDATVGQIEKRRSFVERLEAERPEKERGR